MNEKDIHSFCGKQQEVCCW